MKMLWLGLEETMERAKAQLTNCLTVEDSTIKLSGISLPDYRVKEPSEIIGIASDNQCNMIACDMAAYPFTQKFIDDAKDKGIDVVTRYHGVIPKFGVVVNPEHPNMTQELAEFHYLGWHKITGVSVHVHGPNIQFYHYAGKPLPLEYKKNTNSYDAGTKEEQPNYVLISSFRDSGMPNDKAADSTYPCEKNKPEKYTY